MHIDLEIALTLTTNRQTIARILLTLQQVLDWLGEGRFYVDLNFTLLQRIGELLLEPKDALGRLFHILFQF
jgi:hypothetical protein